MAFYISVPPRFQDNLEQQLLRRDAEANIVRWVSPEDKSTWAQSLSLVGRSVGRIIADVRRSFEVHSPIYHCLTVSPATQSSVFKLDHRTYAIAIHMGMLLRWQGAFRRLLLMPPIAEALGLLPRPDLALPSQSELSRYTDFERLLTPDTTDFTEAWTRTLGHFVGGLHLRLVVLHEVAHALNGHLRLPSVMRRDPVVAHTLEMDADAFAVRMLTHVTLNSPLPFEAEPMPSTEREQRRRLFFALIVVYLCFRQQERHDFDEVTSKAGAHPSGSMRLMMALDVVRQNWETSLSCAGLPFPDELVSITVDLCERAIHQATGRQGKPDLAPVHLVALEWARAYHASLAACWTRIRPELSALKIGCNQLAL